MKTEDRVTVAKTFTMESAHHLPNYAGKCANLHGHSYRLEVAVSGNARGLDESGILVDFGLLKSIVKRRVVDVYDHKCLNDFFDVPSAEVMVSKFFRDIKEEVVKLDGTLPVGMNLRLEYVRLWETATCFAEMRAES